MRRRYKSNLFNDICDQPYSNLSRIKLYNSSKDSRSMIQRMQLMKSLPVHTGCVNSICWNDSGEYILSGSDDQRIIVTHGHTYKVLTEFKTIHRANIFSAKFLPCDNDNQIISCAGDGIILFTDLHYPQETMSNQFTCHSGTTYEVITIPNDPHTFLSCGEDGTVRWFDLRQKTKCLKQHCKEDVLISCHRAVTTIAVNPTAAYQLAIGCSDSRVRLFDRRMIATRTTGENDNGTSLQTVTSYTVAKLEDRSYRITSLCFSPDGEELLASYSSDHLYLFNIKDEGSTQLSAAGDASSPVQRAQPPQSSSLMRRLRLRGDWSDTGPNARPEREAERETVSEEAPPGHATLMQRMTDVLSRMLNDPVTRAALNNNNNNNNNNTYSPEERGDAVPAGAARDEEPPFVQSYGTRRPLGDTESTSLLLGRTHELLQDSLRMADRVDRSTPDRSTADVNQDRIIDVPEEPRIPVPGDSGVKDRLSDPGHGDGVAGDSPLSPFSCVATSSRTEMPSTNQGSESTPEHNPPESVQQSEGGAPESSQSSMNLHVDSAGCTCDETSHSFRHTDSNTSCNSEVNPANTERDSDASSPTPSASTLPSNTAPSDHRHRAGRGHVASAPARVLFNRVLDSMASRQQANALRLVSQSTQTLAAATRAIMPRPEGQGSSSGDSDDDDPTDWYAPRAYTRPTLSKHDGAQEDARTTVKQTYTGHRNARTMIKEACFWGSDHVMSGSDCGHVFVWDRRTAQLVCLLPADQHVVNCLQPHPTLPLLATAGIDHDVKLWAPLAEVPQFDEEFATSLTRRNEVMLEETRDTITVPASFMIRMMACLNQIRRGARGAEAADPAE